MSTSIPSPTLSLYTIYFTIDFFLFNKILLYHLWLLLHEVIKMFPARFWNSFPFYLHYQIYLAISVFLLCVIQYSFGFTNIWIIVVITLTIIIFIIVFWGNSPADFRYFRHRVAFKIFRSDTCIVIYPRERNWCFCNRILDIRWDICIFLIFFICNYGNLNLFRFMWTRIRLIRFERYLPNRSILCFHSVGNARCNALHDLDRRRLWVGFGHQISRCLILI